MVAEAFIGPSPSPEHTIVAHNDGTRDNNHFSNLRWATPLENQRDRVKHGTATFGESTKRAKLTEAAVIDIRERFDSGEKSLRQLAAIHGVSRKLISDIVHRKLWKRTSATASLPLELML